MSAYEPGEQIAEGKTKVILAVKEQPELVIVRSKPEITAHDDPTLTQSFESKARYANITTCNVFALLQASGIPVAFKQQLSETEFLALKSEMVLLEIVARRLAVGSYLKRQPNLATADPTQPRRFHQLLVEFFLKTTGGQFFSAGMPKYAGQDKPIDDPLILNPSEETWTLAHPKAPAWESGTVDGTFPNIAASLALGNGVDVAAKIKEFDLLVRRVSLVLERAWANLGITWVDIKIEVDSAGNVSDVVDNDSWRIWLDGEKLDKQVFRDGGADALEEVEQKYGYVAGLSKRLVLPRQALVVMRGSASDDMPKIPDLPGVEVIDLVGSGHKATAQTLNRVERLFHGFPQGGVILAIAGRSNGLGPITAAHSPWPVISCPPKLGEHPEDVHSSIRMPSHVPNLTAWPASNGVEAAMQFLGMTNPAVYAIDQMAREGRDDYIA